MEGSRHDSIRGNWSFGRFVAIIYLEFINKICFDRRFVSRQHVKVSGHLETSCHDNV